MGEKPIDVAAEHTAAHSLLAAMGDLAKGVDPITVATRRGDLLTVEVLARALAGKITADAEAAAENEKLAHRIGKQASLLSSAWLLASKETSESYFEILLSPMLAALDAHENDIFTYLYGLALSDWRVSLRARWEIWLAIFKDDNAAAAKTMINDEHLGLIGQKELVALAGAPNALEVLIETGGLEKLRDSKQKDLAPFTFKAIEEQSKKGEPIEGHLEVLGLLANHGFLDRGQLFYIVDELGFKLKTIVQRAENPQLQAAAH